MSSRRLALCVAGRVRLPEHVRTALGLSPGDEVELRVKGDALVLTRVSGRPAVGGRLLPFPGPQPTPAPDPHRRPAADAD